MYIHITSEKCEGSDDDNGSVLGIKQVSNNLSDWLRCNPSSAQTFWNCYRKINQINEWIKLN